MISRFYALIINKVFKGTGITYGQVPAIVVTVMEPGTTQDAIARIVGCNKSTISRVLNTLEKTDYVYRKENADNKREKLVYPTEKLVRLKRKIAEGFNDVDFLLFDNFTDEEKLSALHLLDKMIVNCQSRLADDDSP